VTNGVRYIFSEVWLQKSQGGAGEGEARDSHGPLSAGSPSHPNTKERPEKDGLHTVLPTLLAQRRGLRVLPESFVLRS
jgi:hypothetical protein